MSSRFANVVRSLALLAAIAFLAGACSTAGIIGGGAVGEKSEPRFPLTKRVSVNNQSLGRDIQVEDQKVDFSGAVMQASVTIRSATSATLNLQYRFVWFDDRGWEVEPEGSTWRPLVVYGKESKSLQAVAPNAFVREYEVRIRRAD